MGWMVREKNIEPHVPVWEKGERSDGTFGRSDFHYSYLFIVKIASEGKYQLPIAKRIHTPVAPALITWLNGLVHRSLLSPLSRSD